MCILPSRRRASWFVAVGVLFLTLLAAGVATALPVLDSAAPGFGAIGDLVALSGTGFGSTPGQVIFEPGGLSAPVTLWLDDEHGSRVVCRVPEGADATSTVHVLSANGESNDVQFWVYNRVWGLVLDGHGTNEWVDGVRNGSVQGVKVELREFGKDDVLGSTYSEPNGEFWIDQVLDNSKLYELKVTMETEDGKVTMKRGGDTVTFTRLFMWSAQDPGTVNLFPMKWKLSEIDKIDSASISKSEVDNCAAIWHWLYLNREVAKLSGNDLAAPVTVVPYSAFTEYDLDAKEIRIDVPDSNDDAGDGYPLPWVFAKNRESHEFGHALMHSILGYGDVAVADIGNHAGYANKNTGDSLAEGFAEFWACYFDKKVGITGSPEVYDGFGSFGATGVWKAWSPLLAAKPLDPPLGNNVEEFAVATALYKLEPLVGINKIAAALPDGGTFTTFYNNISPGRVDQVRPLFVGQGFFSDTDGDWVWDANEPIGAGNGVKIKIRANQKNYEFDKRFDRKKHPNDPNEFVGITLSGTTSATAESQVTVAVTNPANPAGNYMYKTPLVGSNSKVLMPIPPGYNARITVTGPAGTLSGDSLNITSAQWAAAKAATTAGASIKATFTVEPAPTGMPTACTLLTTNPTVNYGGTAMLMGQLSSSGIPVPGVKVQLQSSSTGTGSWRNVGGPVGTTFGFYQFTVKPLVKTYYRVVSARTADHRSSTSLTISVTPKAWLSNPSAPPRMSRTRYYTVAGYLKPTHRKGTRPVRIYKWRYVSGTWKPYGYVNAKAADYRSYTKYSVKMKLATRGRWRLRARHGDSGHAVSLSKSYDYVTVK